MPERELFVENLKGVKIAIKLGMDNHMLLSEYTHPLLDILPELSREK